MAFKTIDIKSISGIQVVEIPESYRINDDKVYLKKVGDTLYVIPFHNPWDNLIKGASEFSEDFMNEREQPVQQKRELFD
jgi:antitoxin VapB